MNKARILAIDDDPQFLDAIKLVLEDQYEILSASSGETGVKLLEKEPVSAVLLDVHMPPGLNGLEILKRIVADMPRLPVVMATGEKEVKYVVEAMKLGAYDYLSKPIDRERLVTTVRNAVDRGQRERERSNLLEQARSQFPLIGSSAATVAIRQQVRKVARSAQPILITGETGTGKDLVARLIHFDSDRAGAPFVKLNMTSLPDDLIESELFGYKRGAFTGAVADKKGLFVSADGGTLFLDEIGLASLRVQGKILHAIENREFIPLGETKAAHVDVHVVSATNKSLPEEVAAGRFLSDLYYRLTGVTLQVTPLRERTDDLLEIAEHYLKIGAAEQNLGDKSFTAEARRALAEYPWPGNVRELKNVVDRILLFSESAIIDADDVMIQLTPTTPGELTRDDRTLRSNLEKWEREFISKTLLACDYDVPKAAAMLGIHRVSLYKKLKSLGLELKPA